MNLNVVTAIRERREAWRLYNEPIPPRSAQPPESKVRVTVERLSPSGKTTFSVMTAEGETLLKALEKALKKTKSMFREIADVLGPLEAATAVLAKQAQKELEAAENKEAA